MAVKGQKKLLALDTNFLLDLARKELFAEDFRDLFRRLGFQLLIPPTVVGEVVIASEDDSDEKRLLALEVLKKLIRWGIQPFHLNSAEEFIAERFSARLRDKGLLPVEEVNDGIILAETSLGGMSILVTRDKHLLGIDEISNDMKFFISPLLLYLLLNPLLLAQSPGGPEVLRQWSVTIKVVDESGTPLPGVKVSVGYFLHTALGQPLDNINTTNVTGNTDASGRFYVSRYSPSLELDITVTKDNFYGAGETYSLPMVYDLVKYNPTLDYVLKKIGRPVPMYAKWVGGAPPKMDKPIGYDLMSGDWVKPYGTGTTSDFIFTEHLDNARPVDTEYKLTLRFSNPGDGIQLIDVPKRGLNYEGSALRSPHEAPLEGYQPELTKEASIHPGKPPKPVDFDVDRVYLFRVRTELDNNGKVKSTLYGKIYGDFMEFRYYLNPTPNDRDLEFDPKHNLFAHLRSWDRVKAP